MVNIEPHIEVYNVKKMSKPAYGAAGKVAVIGAFPSSTFKVGIFDQLEDAQKAVLGDYKLPDDTSIENASKTAVPDAFISFYCLEHCFIKNGQSHGAESILLVNTNYGKSTLIQKSTNEDIAAALQLLSEEDFDILTLAEVTSLAILDEETYILNPVLQTLKSFNDSQFLNQKPFGIITGFDLSNANTSILASFKALFKDQGIFKAVTTPVRYVGEASSLNMAQSGCWHAAFTAGRAVNLSETGKVYEGIIGENTKDLYPKPGTITWENLLNNGFHTTKYRNRRLSTIQCLSNITPADYDMKIERVKNYMIKRFSLADVLGEDNSEVSRERIEALFAYEKELAIRNGYLVDMDYEILAIDTETVKAKLEMSINDIIRVVILNVTMDITAYEEA